MTIADIEQAQDIFTVSRLNGEARKLLEGAFTQVWVEGEISNFAAPASGHWYFSLKDANSQVRCALFKGSQRKLGFIAKDGMHVLIRARVSLYEARGEYQLVADLMEERGEGKLRRAFEALKKKLETAGLFNIEHKKSLPTFPRTIGVITSSTGAAIRDILHVLNRRYPLATVIIYPTLVQGSTAAPTIVKAIETANKRNECDVVILARGGGSLEDLWPFNEEVVAYAIHQSVLPIITGVGHEVDFTIADFVADYRAPTPSAAAEIITPDSIKVYETLTKQREQLLRHLRQRYVSVKQRLEWTEKHLMQLHPKRQLTDKMQRLDFCELALSQVLARKINKLMTHAQALEKHLRQYSPSKRVLTLQHRLYLLEQKHLNVINSLISCQTTQLGEAAARLNTLSPLATLNRGYAIACKEGHIINDIDKVKVKDMINVRLKNGNLECVIEKIT